MKKILFTVFLIFIIAGAHSQTCEERENKILEVFGGFSAGMLYNTYGMIGSISDAFMHDAYDAVTVSELMDAQIKMADHLVKVMSDLKAGGFLKEENDRDFADSLIIILNGLKKQARLLEEYSDNKSRQRQDAFESQRKQNWSAISKLMGIDE